MAIEFASPTQTEERLDPIAEQIKAEILRFGIENCPQEIIDRLVLLEKNSKFNNDSRMICEGFKNIFGAIKKSLNLVLTEAQEMEGELAAYVHDIGKSGGAEADVEGQMAVIKLFTVTKFTYPIDPKKTVAEAVRECFPEEYEEMMENLAKSGINADMSVRLNFYDQHAYWTRDILEKYPEIFSHRTRLVATSHHMDRGINPYNLPEDEVPTESLLIGALENYVNALEEKVLMAVDKYQAAISRSGSTHDRAMQTIKKILPERYNRDDMMNLILDIIDELGKKDGVFPVTGQRYLSLRNSPVPTI